METKVIESKNANQTANKVNPVTEENKNPKFVAGNTVNKDSVKPEAEKPKEAPKAQEQAKPQPEQLKAEPKAEPKPEPAKFVLNLEGTLKLVDDLARKIKNRNKLLSTVNNLEAFEVELKEEADDTEGNYYSGCTLTITDDKRREFTTKNPTIIWTVAQLVNSMCVDKLAEIEAGIIIPQ